MYKSPPTAAHGLQSYQEQLNLLEEQNKKRLLMARQELDTTRGRPDGQPGLAGPGSCMMDFDIDSSPGLKPWSQWTHGGASAASSQNSMSNAQYLPPLASHHCYACSSGYSAAFGGHSCSVHTRNHPMAPNVLLPQATAFNGQPATAPHCPGPHAQENLFHLPQAHRDGWHAAPSAPPPTPSLPSANSSNLDLGIQHLSLQDQYQERTTSIPTAPTRPITTTTRSFISPTGTAQFSNYHNFHVYDQQASKTQGKNNEAINMTTLPSTRQAEEGAACEAWCFPAYEPPTKHTDRIPQAARPDQIAHLQKESIRKQILAQQAAAASGLPSASVQGRNVRWQKSLATKTVYPESKDLPYASKDIATLAPAPGKLFFGPITSASIPSISTNDTAPNIDDSWVSSYEDYHCKEAGEHNEDFPRESAKDQDGEEAFEQVEVPSCTDAHMGEASSGGEPGHWEDDDMVVLPSLTFGRYKEAHMGPSNE